MAARVGDNKDLKSFSLGVTASGVVAYALYRVLCGRSIVLQNKTNIKHHPRRLLSIFHLLPPIRCYTPGLRPLQVNLR